MKIILAVLSGLALTVGVYAGGFMTAIVFLSADPTPVWKPSRDTGTSWILEPVAVEATDQGLERLPARRATDNSVDTRTSPSSDDIVTDAAEVDPVDVTMTTAIGEDELSGAATDTMPALGAAHVQWCADRYRSYRVEDNSYSSYSGRRRECVSPYPADAGEPVGGDDAYAQADDPSESPVTLSPRHIQACFDRYRSYQPEDNTYQPYGGGPRLQCQ